MATINNLTQTQLSLGFCNLKYFLSELIFPFNSRQSNEMKL